MIDWTSWYYRHVATSGTAAADVIYRRATKSPCKPRLIYGFEIQRNVAQEIGLKWRPHTYSDTKYKNLSSPPLTKYTINKIQALIRNDCCLTIWASGTCTELGIWGPAERARPSVNPVDRQSKQVIGVLWKCLPYRMPVLANQPWTKLPLWKWVYHMLYES